MEEQLRACLNKKCSEFGIPHVFKYTKHCIQCGRKTRFIESYSDTPPAEYVDGQGKLIPITTGTKPIEEKPLVFGAGADDPKLKSQCDTKGCPHEPDAPNVCVPWDLYQKWIFMAHKLNVEWIAYLTGKLETATDTADAAYVLDSNGMYFPEQMATGATVEAETCTEKDGTIAAVHSHVDMSASFSGVDYQHFSHPVELVVNRSGKVSCVVRVQLDCLRYSRVKANVELIGTESMAQALHDLESQLIIREIKQPSRGGSIQRVDMDQRDQRSPVLNRGQVGPCPGCGGTEDQPRRNKYTDSKCESMFHSTEPSDVAIGYALKILRRSGKFREAERLDTKIETST